MGLDMYLTKKTYIGAQYEHRKITGSVSIKKEGKELPIKFDRISEISENVAYWRKENHIHDWFVQNVQDGKDDCGDYYVSQEDLKSLLETCTKVIESAKLVDGQVSNGQTLTKEGWEPNIENGKVIENSKVCEELLPTSSGFFFGGTEYDEWYLQGVKYTAETIGALLKENNDNADFYYSSSW